MKKTHSLVLVFLAGAFGAMLRHMLTVGLHSRGIDEWFATLSVNLAAGLVAGFVVTISSNVHASKTSSRNTKQLSSAAFWAVFQLLLRFPG